MSSESTSSTITPPARGRGRGKSRGGLGKYLRARGRGRGGSGRPAEFHKRLVLEDEETVELEPDSEEAKELAKKYARRQLGGNADRYTEPEADLNSDGEVEKEPEVDLASFLERQRLDDPGVSLTLLEPGENVDDDDVDESLAHLTPKLSTGLKSYKGKVRTIEWNEELEEIRKEKEIADANRGNTVEAPPLPIERSQPPKSEKNEMEDFLDDLLS
ncbi:hypothetical protein EW145_g5745 [Phellinidium pouzarii]|uniref:Uncharacterized protein n=1 Tax=Phellinidium pouzarii TaxID=167371 RepID=A0A4S4KZ29_9AGAM|nr:hypothetical protein EW145_g5745 [Phellinidium pouzarii]